jgi:hypothetical protein
MRSREGIYGLLAEFDTPLELVRAARQARQDGWRRMDCYTPYLVEEAAEAIGVSGNMVPLLTLIGGVTGAVAVFALEVWVSVWAYPVNVGGRPLFSWPAFLVPAFEGAILFAGLVAAIGMLALNGFPALYHPLFNAPNFCDGATTDKFFLCLEAQDPKFDLVEARKYLESFQPVSVVEVEY